MDERALIAAFLERNARWIDKHLNEHGFARDGCRVVGRKLFITEDPERLYINFAMAYSCVDIADQNRRDATLLVRGDGAYNPQTREFMDMRIWAQALEFCLQNGARASSQGETFGSINASLGRREIRHSVRYPLLAQDFEE